MEMVENQFFGKYFSYSVNAILASKVRKRAPARLTFNKFSTISLLSISLLLFTPLLLAPIELLMLGELKALRVVFNIKMSRAAIVLKP